MVPNGWEHVRLSGLCLAVTSGSRDWAKYYSDQGSKFIRMTNLQRENIYLNLSDLKYVDVQSNSSDGKRTSLKVGDILMSITAELGKIGWVHDGLGEAFINQHTALIRLDDKKTNSKYIAYLLSSKDMNHRINRLNDSGAKAGLNLPTIRSIPLNVPPLQEQHKIANILATWDKAISTTERLIDNSKQQKKALMQQLLTGKKRLLDDSGKPFEGEWKNKLFKNILKLDRGSSPRPIVEYITEDVDGVNWIKIGDTKGNGLYINSTKEKITKEGAKKSRKVNKGEIIVSNSMSYGKPYILNIDGYIHDGWFVIRDYESSLDVKFLLQILGSELIQKQYKRLAAGGVVSNISSELVYAVEIDLPTITEQQKIATVLVNADNEIELLEQQLADLKQEKKALMQQLLTGKRRVKVDEKEVA